MRDQGLRELFFTGDIQAKAVAGYLKQITVSLVGGGAGQAVVLRDGLDNSAPPMCQLVFSAANGSVTKEWPDGKYFATGLFIDVQGGVIQGDITFR